MSNIHNLEHKYAGAQKFCIPVQDNTVAREEQTTRAVNLNTQPQNLLPVLPLPSIQTLYTRTFQQYFNHFASYINPIVNYPMLNHPFQSDIEIEKYINYEVNKQKTMMNNQNARTLRPVGQLQIQRQLQLATMRKAPPKKAPQEHRIINVELVAMAGNLRKTGKPTDVAPLPPVEPEFKDRVCKIARSQQHYTKLFGRLTTMLQTLNSRYDGSEAEPEEEIQVDEAPSPPLKRPRHNMSSSSSDSHLDVENNPKDISKYPVRVSLKDGNYEYLLGPNGTQITAKEYIQVFWTSAPIATRCLLSAVFTSDELATHTLTGKPSPAFYGRERPAKKMLDPRRVDDIIVSVRNRTGGKERHIRATITTKCADTAKKYRRRAKKAGQENIIVLDD